MKIVHVVGARPNFMKVAPVIEALTDVASERGVELQQVLVHTGQHYTPEMSKLLFDDLGLPVPDINLNVGSGSHGAQTGKIMMEFEKALLDQGVVDLVSVLGDVNSTIACALVAAKLGVKVAHVEAGLRSFDRDMPEEINRVLTDQISDWLFTTEESAEENLRREGIDPAKVHFVGNVMIDTLLKHRSAALKRDKHASFGLEAGGYGVVTLHRPSNVDIDTELRTLLDLMQRIARELPLLWPMHPRTKSRIDALGMADGLAQSGITICEPLGYLDFMCCVANARMVFTDSGGIQEETTILQVPCVTIRENTERPITVSQGTNVLAGTAPEAVWQAFKNHPWLAGSAQAGTPALWDGSAGTRIAEVLLSEG